MASCALVNCSRGFNHSSIGMSPLERRGRRTIAISCRPKLAVAAFFRVPIHGLVAGPRACAPKEAGCAPPPSLACGALDRISSPIPARAAPERPPLAIPLPSVRPHAPILRRGRRLAELPNRRPPRPARARRSTSLPKLSRKIGAHFSRSCRWPHSQPSRSSPALEPWTVFFTLPVTPIIVPSQARL